jgi:hypothetical protein
MHGKVALVRVIWEVHLLPPESMDVNWCHCTNWEDS